MLKGVVIKKIEWLLLDDVGILFRVLKCFLKIAEIAKTWE
jgi:hypothetical protein